MAETARQKKGCRRGLAEFASDYDALFGCCDAVHALKEFGTSVIDIVVHMDFEETVDPLTFALPNLTHIIKRRKKTEYMGKDSGDEEAEESEATIGCDMNATFIDITTPFHKEVEHQFHHIMWNIDGLHSDGIDYFEKGMVLGGLLHGFDLGLLQVNHGLVICQMFEDDVFAVGRSTKEERYAQGIIQLRRSMKRHYSKIRN